MIYTMGKKGSFPRGIALYLVPLLLGFAAADVTMIYLRSQIFPEKMKAQKKVRRAPLKKGKSYSQLSRKNFLNPRLKNPPALSELSPSDIKFHGNAVKSNLPYTLLGTIVHTNPKRSVATLKNQGKINSFSVGDSIGNEAEVVKIERRKIIFVNASSRQLEYIDIPERKGVFTLSRKDSQGATRRGRGARYKRSQGSSPSTKQDVAIEKKWLEKQLNNFDSILTLARVEPVLKKGEVAGYQFKNIQPGSPYEKIGFLKGDIIKKVNGDEVKSPNQAIEMYHTLKDASEVTITVERNGREIDFNYTLRE